MGASEGYKKITKMVLSQPKGTVFVWGNHAFRKEGGTDWLEMSPPGGGSRFGVVSSMIVANTIHSNGHVPYAFL